MDCVPQTVRMSAVAALALLLASCQTAPRSSRPIGHVVVREELAQRVPASSPVPADSSSGRAVGELLASPLTEAAAMRLALALNPDVREGYERLGVARYELMQAGLLSNPTLAADVKFFSAGPEIEFGLTKPVLDLLFVRHRRAIASAEREVVEADVTANLVELLFSIRRHMIELRSAQRVVGLREEVVAAAETTTALSEKLYDAGNILDQARTSARIAQSRAHLELDAARSVETEKREGLRRLLGLPPSAPVIALAAGSATEHAAPLDRKQLVTQAQHASLELRMKRAAAQVAQRGRTLVRARRGTWLRDGGGVGKREAESGAWGFGPEVGIEIPVFDPGAAEIGAASAAYRRACAEARAVRLDVVSAARRFTARAAVAAERERRMREEYLPLRKQYVKDLVGRYNDMQIGAFQVLEAKTMEIDARREHAATLRDAELAQADIDELVAGHLNRERLEATDMPEAADHPALTGGGH